jgi:hypothetical protein
MRLAIFGYPRSGSSYLYDTILKHLVSSGAIAHDCHLQEIFIRHPRYHIGIKPNTKNTLSLYLKQYPNLDNPYLPLSNEQRFDLLKQFSEQGQDYFFKMLSGHTRDERVLPWLIENYPIITICRRDHFDAYISWLVAIQHGVWNRVLHDPPSVYTTFRVPRTDMDSSADTIRRYFTHVKKIPAKAHIYYEDMIAMSPEEVLRHVGVYQPGFEIESSPIIKLLELSDKLELIVNLDEVTQYYDEFIKPIVEK